MNPFNKHFTSIAFLFLLSFRIAMLCVVQPGNAPDEIGHMLMAVSLAQGKYLTLQESLGLIGYPYPIYNPLGYFPSALALFLGSLVSGIDLSISKPFLFTGAENILARFGMQFWSICFLFFFLKLIKKFSTEIKAALALCVGLVPQLIFVQSYVNLDSVGMTVFLYLLWASFEKREGHLALATFFLGCCKMNFFCLFLIPLFYVWFHYRNDFTRFLKKSFFILAAPSLLASTWFVFSYFVNTRQYGSFFGFNALPDIYQSPKAGFRVFSLEFLNISLNSAFGRFGWMSIRIPEFLSFPWRVLILPASFYCLVRVKRRDQEPSKTYALMSLLIVLSNFGIHFWGSFNNDYQPQGRYILPAILILLSYLALELNSKWRQRLCVFMLISSVLGLGLAARRIPNPPGLLLTAKAVQEAPH